MDPKNSLALLLVVTQHYYLMATKLQVKVNEQAATIQKRDKTIEGIFESNLLLTKEISL